MHRTRWPIFVAAAAVMAVTTPAPQVHAEDFFSALFRGFGMRRMAPPTEQGPFNYAPERPSYSSRRSSWSGPAYCVRTCDGRYFPAPPAANQSRAETCKSFCPAAETNVFYGPTIDDASSESGKSYGELANAYKYRTELVAGCTCNGTDPVGLAKIDISNDKSLRRGDLVVEPDGVKVATGRADRQGASVDLVPAPPDVRSRFVRRPSMAAQ